MTNRDGTSSIFTVAFPICGGVAALVFDDGAALCAKARAGMHRTAATVTNLMVTFSLRLDYRQYAARAVRRATPAYDMGVRGMPMMSMKMDAGPSAPIRSPSNTW